MGCTRCGGDGWTEEPIPGLPGCWESVACACPAGEDWRIEQERNWDADPDAAIERHYARLAHAA